MPQTETMSSYPTLVSREGLKDLLNGISPYTARRYRTTYTTTMSSTDMSDNYTYSISTLIGQFYNETLDSSTNNNLQQFDLIEIIVTTSDSVSFPLLIQKISNDVNIIFFQIFFNGIYISGIRNNSTIYYTTNSFMSVSDIQNMLNNVNQL